MRRGPRWTFRKVFEGIHGCQSFRLTKFQSKAAPKGSSSQFGPITATQQLLRLITIIWTKLFSWCDPKLATFVCHILPTVDIFTLPFFRSRSRFWGGANICMYIYISIHDISHCIPLIYPESYTPPRFLWLISPRLWVPVWVNPSRFFFPSKCPNTLMIPSFSEITLVSSRSYTHLHMFR